MERGTWYLIRKGRGTPYLILSYLKLLRDLLTSFFITTRARDDFNLILDLIDWIPSVGLAPT